MAATGLIDKEIAVKLGVTLATVRTYWERIRKKLDATNRAHAIALGMPHNKIERAGDEVFEFLVHSIEHEAISMCDENGRFLTWNKGVLAVTGYTAEEWIGQHHRLIFLPEEESEADQEFRDADKAGASVNDRWHLHKDGHRFWGTNIVIPLTGAGAAGYAKIVRPKPSPKE